MLVADGTCCTSLLLDIFVQGLFSQGHVRLNEGEFISDIMRFQNAESIVEELILIHLI